jgi:transposase-like protein
MARPTLDQKTRAQHHFVVEGITNLSELERRIGVSRVTLTKWRDQYEWETLRTARKQRELEDETSPEAIVQQIRQEIQLTIAKMQENRDAERMPDPDLDKRISRLVSIVAKLDGMWYSKSLLIKMGNEFVDFVAGRPDLKDALAALRLALPAFVEHVEKTAR